MNVHDNGSREGVQSVERAFDLLLQLIDAPSLGAAELQAAVGLSRPTVYRLLGTMERRKILQSSGQPRRYELGPRFVELANAWLSQSNIARVAGPFLRELWEAAGETVVLSVLKAPDSRVTVQQFKSNAPSAYTPGLGKLRPLFYGASGKAILAFLAPEEIERIVAPAPVTLDRAGLNDTLARVRRDGYAYSAGELESGAASIAAPLFDERMRPVASIAVAMPRKRLNEDVWRSVVPLVIETARSVSALGLRSNVR